MIFKIVGVVKILHFKVTANEVSTGVSYLSAV